MNVIGAAESILGLTTVDQARDKTIQWASKINVWPNIAKGRGRFSNVQSVKASLMVNAGYENRGVTSCSTEINKVGLHQPKEITQKRKR